MIEKSTNIDEYFTPDTAAEAEIKIKGSKFIARVIPVRSKKEAEDNYAALKKKYYDATHNCFAYRINEQVFRYSDDGEPSGTAGKPIYQVLEAARLNEILCVVTRYYGGTKLGTGGLIRAYSQAAKLALDNTKIKIKVFTQLITLKFSYELENLVRNTINEFKGSIGSSDYSDHIVMDVKIPQSKHGLFREKLTELSNSTIKIIMAE
jgi:uncharacterized YigZ family protein